MDKVDRLVRICRQVNLTRLTKFLAKPCLARELPSGPEWSYEVKLDGCRALGLKSGGRTSLWSRNGKDFSRLFPNVTLVLGSLSDRHRSTARSWPLTLTDSRHSNCFRTFRTGRPEIVFYAFDMPFMAGRDLRNQPLTKRRGALRDLVAALPDPIRYSDTFEVPGRRS